MEEARLPAALEVSTLLRRTHAMGGYAMVLHKGEPDGGTILVVAIDRAGLGTLYERMPVAQGGRRWIAVRQQNATAPSDFEDYLQRRKDLDRDLWIIELTIAEVERSILNIG